ncbi:MAG: hypothetical protein AAFP97_08090 [Pseudomonadota bacterium]
MQTPDPRPFGPSPVAPIAQRKGGHNRLSYYLLRFWVLGVPLALIGLAIGFYLSRDYQPTFQASSLIALERSATSDGSEDPLQEQTILFSEAVVLESRTVIDSVVDRLELDETLAILPDWNARLPQQARIQAASNFVDDALSVSEQIDRRTLSVDVTTPDPILSADIANAATDIFIELRGNRRQEWLDRERNTLEARVATLKQDLLLAEERLFAEVENSEPVSGGQSRTVLQQDLSRAESQTLRLQAEADRLQSLNPVSLAATDPELAMVRLERGRLQDEYNRLSADLGPLHPRMVALQDQIDGLSAQFETGIAERRAAARAAMETAQAEEAALRTQLETTENQLRESAQLDFATSALKRDVDLLSLQLTRAVEDLAAFQTQSVSDPLFTIRERALVPNAPVLALETFNPSLGLILGGLLGFGLFVLQDRLRDRVSHPRDISDKLGETLIGVVPKEKGRDRVASSDFDPQTPIAEAAASIVARIIKKKPKDSALIVHITSTRSGEGKSTLALALARAFASTGDALASEIQQGKVKIDPTNQPTLSDADPTQEDGPKAFSGYRTLIIDADMRRPSFVVENPDAIGLETVLKEPNLLSKAVRPTSNSALFLLPCKTVAENPAGLLSGDNFPEMLDFLRPVLDVIVIDGPPTLGLADAALIGQSSDLSLYVVEQNGLRRDHVAAAIARMKESGCTIGGVILTKFDLGAFSQSDMYRYTYGNESYAYGDEKKKGLFGRFKSSERSIQLK